MSPKAFNFLRIFHELIQTVGLLIMAELIYLMLIHNQPDSLKKIHHFVRYQFSRGYLLFRKIIMVAGNNIRRPLFIYTIILRGNPPPESLKPNPFRTMSWLFLCYQISYSRQASRIVLHSESNYPCLLCVSSGFRRLPIYPDTG